MQNTTTYLCLAPYSHKNNRCSHLIRKYYNWNWNDNASDVPYPAYLFLQIIRGHPLSESSFYRLANPVPRVLASAPADFLTTPHLWHPFQQSGNNNLRQENVLPAVMLLGKDSAMHAASRKQHFCGTHVCHFYPALSKM